MNETDIVFLNDLKAAVNQAIHHCNNHLAIVLSNSELILALENPDSTKKKTESTLARVALLTDLLAQLGQLFNLDPSFEKINLNSFLKAEVGHHSSLAAAEGIQVSTEINADGDTNVRASAVKLLIHILFRNAVSALKPSPEKNLRVSVKKNNGLLDFELFNSGAAPESLEESFLFHSFFPAKKESTCDFLASAACLTRLLGGKINFSRVSNDNLIKVSIPV
jgi:signal transduction histidine kinase